MSLSVHIRHRLEGFDLEVDFDAPSGLTALFGGASGTGKTSVVNAVAGLSRPDQARIAVGDWTLCDTTRHYHLPPHKRRLGYIFQEGRLFPHLTVRQNLRYGGAWFTRQHGPGDDMGRVVEMLGIGPLLDRRPPGALSGGEKQRVAIGRALLAKPRLILADEPLAALDEARKAEILPYFERLRDEAGIPILYVSHSPPAEVARLATTVVALERGKVARMAPPPGELFSDPGFRPPAGPRAIGAVLEARIAAHHDDGLTELDAGGVSLFLPPHVAEPPHGHPVRVRIAAQDVTLSLDAPGRISALNILSGTVDEVQAGGEGGPGAVVALTTPAGRVLARVTRRSVAALDLRPGLACHAIVKTVSIAPGGDVGGGG